MPETPPISPDDPAAAPPQAYARLATSPDEIREAQELRYKVFYEEYGATPTPQIKQERRDFDEFDTVADHLVVLARDPARPDRETIVGTYRLLRQEIAEKHGRFYSGDEYDIAPLLRSGQRLLELGRSCVLAEYRTRPILNLLWQGIADYITEHDLDLLFGCASFQGTDIEAIAPQLSYLHHFHATPEDLRPVALPERYVDMNLVPKEEINERRAFAALPPLIKGYLRLGASIGEGAVIDAQFNTTDVCIVVQKKLLTERYRKYYERRLNKPMTRSAEEESEE